MLKLDIDSAIAAHKAWFASLQAGIEGVHAKQILEMSVANHSKCVLGAWLHSTAPEAFADRELFRSIQEVHIEFHQVAGMIIDHLERGNADKALHLLDKKLPLVSDALVLLLVELQRKQDHAGNPNSDTIVHIPNATQTTTGVLPAEIPSGTGGQR